VLRSNSHVFLVLRKAHIHLHNVKDQREHVGWYPLVGNIGQSGISKDALEKNRGSIRLRVQWIYNTSGLLDYYLLCTERRLAILQSRRDGLKRQLTSVRDAVQQAREQEESFAIKTVPALALLHKKKKSMYIDPPTTGARDDNDFQSSKVRGVSAKDKLKRTINAARFMGKIKRLSDVDNKNESAQSFHSGSMFEDDSIRVTNDSLTSQDWIVDSAVSASLINSQPSNTSESSGRAQTKAALSFLSLSHLMNYAENDPSTRLLHLRWQTWKHKMHNGEKFSPVSSWNISHVLVNLNVTSSTAHEKKQRSRDENDEFLMLPPATPILIVRREKNELRALRRSRALFSKAARRSLGSIFNPGGVLTIRPITALNLPDHFTSMFLKLRCVCRLRDYSV
jgi:hypothetical protein